MKLLTQENRRQLPALYSQENEPDPIVQVKFFMPGFGWTWYATEFDGEDMFFGLVIGQETELGYFTLAELQAVTGRFGLKVERDRYFKPAKLSAVKELHQ